jgi:hypothetical protein
MQITVSVTLDEGQTLAYTPDEAAAQVLAALDGDAEVDHCVCYIAAPTVPGEAGTPPESPEPEQPEAT